MSLISVFRVFYYCFLCDPKIIKTLHHEKLKFLRTAESSQNNIKMFLLQIVFDVLLLVLLTFNFYPLYTL